MTTKRAFEIVEATDSEPHQADFQEASDTLVKAGWCPSCAEDGHRVKLGKFEPPTHETYGGRWCTVCEMFWPAPGRAGDMEPNEPDYGGAFDGNQVTSDADPGL